MKYLGIIKYVLIIISVAAIVVGITASVDIMLRWAYVLLILTIGLSVLMPLFGILKNPKSAVRGLIGLAIIVAVFLAAYAMSSAEPIPLPSGDVLDNEMALRFSDTALYATYFMFAGVILSIVGSELYKVIK